MMDSTLLILLIIGFILVVGSLAALTTFGKKRPVAVLIGMFIAFTAYISIILVRIEVIDLSWLWGGAS